MLPYLGYIAGLLTTIAFLPQVIKSHKAKKLDEISLLTFLLFTIGILFWVIYGFTIRSNQILIPNVITFLLAGYILFLKIKRG